MLRKLTLYFLEKKSLSLAHNDVIKNGNVIQNVEHTKFLGICIDSMLSWDLHITAIETKFQKFRYN